MKKNNSRRDFLKKGLTGITAAALAPSLIRSGEDKDKGKTTLFRTLGRTGIRIPVVSMGVMNADNPKLVEAALEKGLTYLDTAHVYQRGKNEEMVGEVLKGRKRDSFFVATKVPGIHADRKTGLFTDKTDPADLVEKFGISLKRLGLDHVDVLLLHSVTKREAVLFEPLMSAMQKLKKEGKARFIGVSTHRNEPEAIRAVADSNVYDVVLTAYNFLQPHLAEMHSAIDYAAGKGIGIVAMKTQAGVYWDKEKQDPINMKAALKWALQNKNVHTAIPGFTTFDQLNLDAEVMSDITLTAQEISDLKLTQKVAGLYCRQCGLCTPQCSRGLDIPTLMRSYMYAFGYRNLLHAKDTLEGIDLDNLPCDDCRECGVTCSVGFDVRGKIAEIAKIGRIDDTFLV